MLKTLCTFSLICLLATPVLAADRKPNILLIVSDDHGYGDVGANGCKDIPTPSLDALAAGGVRFTSGYVSGPYCSPTRAGLMTGRYQTRFGHEFNPGPATSAESKVGLSLDETPLPQRLKAAGYVTGMVGKWHLGYEPEFHPQQRGFDEFFGFLGGAHSYVNAQADGANPILRGQEKVDEKEYLTDAFGREAVAFIDRHAQESWFLYVPFNAVHGPMDVSPRHKEKFPHLSGGRQTYATMLTALDEAIGKIISRLKEHKLDEQTLILFVADNGGPEDVNSSDNGPLRGHKAQTLEGGIRVPFMMRWTGQLPAGLVYDHPVIQLDFAPTALAAAGIEVDASVRFDGVNLLPYLKGSNAAAPHEALYWRFGQQMAIRKGDWKIVRSEAAGLAETQGESRREVVKDLTGAHLYNLRDDIGETKNLAESHPEKFKELADAWYAWNAGNIEPKWLPRQRGARNRRQNTAQ